MKLSTTWKHWLANHETNDLYNQLFGRIISSLDTDSMTGSECFDFLTQFENLVLLTVSDKNYIIPSFFHKKFGNELLGEPIIAAALCGFGEKAYPTRIEIDKKTKS